MTAPAALLVFGFFDIGFSELMVCGAVALLLFGGRLPEVMRSLGAAYRNFRRGMEDLTRQATIPSKPAASLPYRPQPRPAPLPPPAGGLEPAPAPRPPPPEEPAPPPPAAPAGPPPSPSPEPSEAPAAPPPPAVPDEPPPV